MRLLLDTHVLLWAIADAPRLSATARRLIDDRSNTVFVSTVSLWEIAVKHGLGRGRPDDMPISSAEALAWVEASDFEILPVLPPHAVAVETLPRLHGDPFDRLLIAQAACEPLKLVTHDKVVASYSDAFILV